MKRYFFGLILVALGFGAGFWLRATIVRTPLSSTSSVIHYCSCVEDSLQNQVMVLEASNEVNRAIENMTQNFTKEHGVGNNDFGAAFIPHGNGYYTFKVWCSNRSNTVHKLYESYSELAHTCLRPHTEALEKAHASNHN